MINWTHAELAIAIHDRQVAEYGGTPGVRDGSLLELTLARPQQLFTYREPRPDLADLAATLAFGIARNHPFNDANKRTALVAYRTFLAMNNAELRANSEEKYATIMGLADGQLSERRFAAWLRERIRIREQRVTGARHSPKRRKPAARRKAKKR